MKKDKNIILKNNQGQSLIEFLLLTAVLMGLSYGLLAGMNGYVGKRWVNIIKVIARPTQSTIELL